MADIACLPDLADDETLVPGYADAFHLNRTPRTLHFFFLRTPAFSTEQWAKAKAAGAAKLPVVSSVSVTHETALEFTRLLAEQLGYQLTRKAGGN